MSSPSALADSSLSNASAVDAVADESVADGCEVITFGCRLNAWESAVMRRHLASLGMRDVVVVNSCAVTAEAERQFRACLRRVRRTRPNAHLVATGCAMSLEHLPERARVDLDVDAVLANGAKLQRASWEALARRFGAEPRTDTDANADANADTLARADISVSQNVRADISVRQDANADADVLVPELPPLVRARDFTATRAFVELQHGCDHRCTFCTIPFARGAHRSVPLEEAVRRVRALTDDGVREVVLTGVDLTSWGSDLPGAPRLGDAARTLLDAVPQLARLRLSSLDPAALDDELLALWAREPRLQPHAHLSMQAGDDLILKRMRRRHLTADLEACVVALRGARPDMALGADLIAGFPTESEQAFERGFALVERLRIPLLHVFPYSVRPGTPAARMPQVEPGERKRRAAALRGLGARLHAEYRTRFLGRRTECLFESPTRARTPEGLIVDVPESAGESAGALVHLRLESLAGDGFCGAPA